MDIGMLPEFRNPTQWTIPIEQVYREGIEKAVLAERLGFDHFWASEHHFAVDSLVTLAAHHPGSRGRPYRAHPTWHLHHHPALPSAVAGRGRRGLGRSYFGRPP